MHLPQTICAQNAEIQMNGAHSATFINFSRHHERRPAPAQAPESRPRRGTTHGPDGLRVRRVTRPSPGCWKPEKLGFHAGGKHCSRTVLYRQNGINFIPEPRAPQPGRVLRRRAWPRPAAWPFRVKDAHRTYNRAGTGRPAHQSFGPMGCACPPSGHWRRAAVFDRPL